MLRQGLTVSVVFFSGWFLGTCWVLTAHAQEPGARGLLEQLQARQKQNFAANMYCEVTDLNKPSQRDENWVYRYKLLQGYGKAKCSGTGLWPGSGGTWVQERAFDGEGLKIYNNWEQGRFDVSGPSDFVRGGSGVVAEGEEVAYSWFFTKPHFGGWLRGQDIGSKEDLVAKLLAAPEEGVALSKMTSEEGKQVLKLSASLDTGDYALYFDPALDYNLIEISCDRHKDIHSALEEPLEEEGYVSSINYTQIEGVWFSTGGELEFWNRISGVDEKFHYVYRTELTDVELLDEQPVEAFRIEWPEGCRVTDRTRGDATFFVDAEGNLLPEGDPRVTALQLDKALDAAVADLAKADEERAATYRGDTRSQEGLTPGAGEEQTPIEQPSITSRRAGIVVAVLASVVCVGVLAGARTRRGARV